MRILIISDTHGRDEIFDEVLSQAGEIDMLIHCGDIEGHEAYYRKAVNCPVWMVPGNNDYFSTMPRDIQFEIDGINVWVTHGHAYRVSLGMDYLVDEAMAREADVVMFGHIHRPMIEQIGDLTLLNPGSLTYPRQENRKPSYIIMETDENEEPCYNIYYVE